MRILVICVPRSGTTSFLNSLSSATGIPVISLPDNYTYPDNYSLITNVFKIPNFILRVVPSQNVGTSLAEFSKVFDYTVLMSRKDIKKHLESYVNVYYRTLFLKQNVSNSTVNNDIVYDYSNIPNKVKNSILQSDLNKQLIDVRKQIIDLSFKLNLKVLYYEDLYYSDDKLAILKEVLDQSKIDIPLLLDNLNKTKKLRNQFSKTII